MFSKVKFVGKRKDIKGKAARKKEDHHDHQQPIQVQSEVDVEQVENGMKFML